MDTHVRPIGVAQEGPTLLLHSTVPTPNDPICGSDGDLTPRRILKLIQQRAAPDRRQGQSLSVVNIGLRLWIDLFLWNYICTAMRRELDRRPYLVSLFST